MYVMSADGKVLSAPAAKPWPHKHPKCSDCAPLFMKVVSFPFFYLFCCFRFLYVLSNILDVLQSYLMRGAGAVIHSHGMETCMATMLVPGAKEFRVSPPSLFYISHEIQLIHKVSFVFP